MGAIAGPTVYLTRWIFLAEGTTRRQLKWSMFQAPVMVLGVIIGLKVGLDMGNGALGVAYGFAGVMVLLAIPRVWYATVESKLKPSQYWLSAARESARLCAVRLAAVVDDSRIRVLLTGPGGLGCIYNQLLFVFYHAARREGANSSSPCRYT